MVLVLSSKPTRLAELPSIEKSNSCSKTTQLESPRISHQCFNPNSARRWRPGRKRRDFLPINRGELCSLNSLSQCKSCRKCSASLQEHQLQRHSNCALLSCTETCTSGPSIAKEIPIMRRNSTEPNQPSKGPYKSEINRKSKEKSKIYSAHFVIPSILANIYQNVKSLVFLNVNSTNKVMLPPSPKFSVPKMSTIKPNLQRQIHRTKLISLPTLKATSFFTLLTLISIETVLLSTMSNCAKTFYMHWNTSNSIFRIDNTDHIIDVNKGNLAFEFDQVHIICPVYEPGTFDNETEKYIIYNVSKVEYETCRITNADPRVIAICDKPQKLMFFTITFRPFTPQPGGLEFLPGNDYYFISTSSKDDLYRRIGGRCSTNNMKVVFKVCCASEEKFKTTPGPSVKTAGSVGSVESGSETVVNGFDNAPTNIDNLDSNVYSGNGNHMVPTNTIGINSVNTDLLASGGVQLKPITSVGSSINSNFDQFNRIPIQPNIMGNNIGGQNAGSGILVSPGHGSINMLPPVRSGVNTAQYPNHHHIQSGIRINNMPTQHNYPSHKGTGNINDDLYDKHPNEVVKNEELTYNSAAQGARSTKTFVWIWSISSKISAGNKPLPYKSGSLTQFTRTCWFLASNLHPVGLLAVMLAFTFHYLVGIITVTGTLDLSS